MICKKCGFEMEDGFDYCPKCGTKVVLEVETEAVPHEEQKHAGCWRVFAIVSKILGIVSLASCWIPIFAMIPGCAGIVFSCLGRAARTPETDEMTKKSLARCIVGTCISFVLYFAVIALIIIFPSQNHPVYE